MIDFFNSLPFRRKLIMINIAIILPVIIIGTIISINVIERNGRIAVKNQVSTYGELTASFLIPDLLFNDNAAVKTTLENFEELSNVSYATVLDNNNQPTANYGKIEQSKLERYRQDMTSRFEKDDFIFFTPINYKNENLGTLLIINNTKQLQQTLNNIYIGIIVASIFSFFVLIAASSWIQKLITRPILKLVKIIKDVVTTRDYSKRIEENPYGDEIGTLYDDFNTLLKTIDQTTVSQTYLDNVMGSLAEMVIVLDENGKINSINKAVTRLTKFTYEDLRNQFPTMLLSDFERNKDNRIFECQLKTKNNHLIVVAVSITQFINIEQKQRTILSIRDITDRKTAENNLKKNYAKLERTNKELEELSYILSHDLKTPVRGIGSLITMMQQDFEDDDLPKSEQSNYFRLIKKRINRMESLINGILEFSKVNAESAQELVDMNKIVKEVTEIVVPDNFEVNVPKSLPMISFNQIQMYQLLQNLMGNAVKYNDKPIGKIDILWEDSGDKYEFRVKDNGIGIAPQYHDKIFKVFQMLESRDTTESVGIGLSIVKKIIEKENGKIWIDSDYEEGVAFVFELPK